MSWREDEDPKDRGFVRETGRRQLRRHPGARGRVRRDGRRQQLKPVVQRAVTEVRKALALEMEEMAREVLVEAQRLAPKDTLELVESGYVEQTSDGPHYRYSEGGRERLGRSPGWVVGFRAPHAAIQHERLDYYHDDGQAKYLETAMDNVAARAVERLAEAAREVLE